MEKINDSRVQAMFSAIELGVDASDFSFYSMTERVLWRELETEREEFFSKHGPTWVAEAA
jgi:hypothetical protein